MNKHRNERLAEYVGAVFVGLCFALILFLGVMK